MLSRDTSDALQRSDQTQDGQHPVESKELLDPLNYDRTCLVWPTEHALASSPLWTNTCAPRHHDLTLNSDCSTFDHCYVTPSVLHCTTFC